MSEAAVDLVPKKSKGGKPSAWAPINLLTSMVMVFPLFLVYSLGILVVPKVQNGADFITLGLLQILHGNVTYYLLLQGAMFAAFGVTLLVLRRKNRFDRKMVWRVLAESSVYALVMGFVIVLVMTNLLHIDPRLAMSAESTPPSPADLSFLSRVILSFGAGFHEELLFRLLGLTGLVALFHKAFGMRRVLAFLLGLFISSVLFSAAHHIVGGEPWRIGVFVYRILCGVIFGVIFWTRGFAVAVYTHALYDIYVLVMR